MIGFTRQCMLSFIFILVSLFSSASAQTWPEVFDPMVVKTLNFELDPLIWEDIKRDTNYYDPVLNIRVPVLMWADGEEPITVQMRRKSDPALPSEENPQKVSLKIDINEYVVGQRWHDLTKLSLENGNGGNGPIREALSMNLHRLAAEAGFGFGEGAPGHASWVRVVVNSEYIGLYASPEQRDKQFLRNRGLYKPGSVWLYEVNGETTLDETVALTNSPTFDGLCYLPFKDRDPCPQPDLESELPNWVDMDSMLTLAAIEAYCGNTDGLIFKGGKNSFAVDFLPTAQYLRWYLPWDLDNGMINTTFNIYGSSGPGGKTSNYVTQIIGHAWFGEHYKHIMRDLIDGPLQPATLNAFISQLETVLTPALLEDPNNMSGGGDPAAMAATFQSIRDWVTARDANVRTQLGTMVLPPLFSQNGGAITPDTQISISHGNGSGSIYYTLDGSDPRGLAGIVAGTTYSGPVSLATSSHIKARVLVGAEWSALREASFTVPGHAADLKISEIMYRPVRDENLAGVEQEFIELKNTGATPINLSGLRFTNGISYVSPNGAILAPGEFLVLGENEKDFETRHGNKPSQIYRRQLANDGERLTITDALGNNVFSVRYESQLPWPVLANGHGFSLVPGGSATASGPDDVNYWRASAEAGGSPGADDSEPVLMPVLVTEALTHTDLPLRDAIEVYNPNDEAVDLGGWFLSDKLSEPKRWKIPVGTVIDPQQYLVFYESDTTGQIEAEHFGSAFSLSSLGDEVYLSSANAAEVLTGYSNGFAFGASVNGVSFGLHVISTGDLHYPPQSERTLGAANASPKVGPVVITELMYNPATGGDEFIEIKNISTTPLDLYHPAHPELTWRVAGVDFNFSQGVTLAAGEVVLMVPIDPETFRAKYNIPFLIRIFGPYPGSLSNSGETVRLRMPDDPLLIDGITTIPYIDVDTVNYSDGAPWPAQPDGFGPGLERILPDSYADDPANWRASAETGGSPGSVSLPENNFSTWASGFGLFGDTSLPLADGDRDGIVNLLEYAFDLDPTVPGTAGMPSGGVASDGGLEYLSITFTRRLDDSSLVYEALFSSSLTPWVDESGIQIGEATAAEGGLTETVTFRDSIPMHEAGIRFGRVRVEQP